MSFCQLVDSTDFHSDQVCMHSISQMIRYEQWVTRGLTYIFFTDTTVNGMKARLYRVTWPRSSINTPKRSPNLLCIFNLMLRMQQQILLEFNYCQTSSILFYYDNCRVKQHSLVFIHWIRWTIPQNVMNTEWLARLAIWVSLVLH